MKKIIFISILFLLLGLTETAFCQKKVFIVHLRGGLDALSAIQPFNTALEQKRPYLYQEQADLIQLTGYNEGFHPELSEFAAAFTADHLTVIHKVGASTNTNSDKQAYSVVSRGVPFPDHEQQSGWLQRLAEPRFSQTNAVDLYSQSLAFAGGNYLPIQVYGLGNIAYYDRDDSRDFAFRLDNAQNILHEFQASGSAINKVKAAYDLFQNTSYDLRSRISDIGLPPTGNNSGQYRNNTPGYRFREAEFLLRHIDTKVVYCQLGGFETFSSQQDLIEDRLEELNDAIQVFRQRMISANAWNNTVVAIISDGGRSISEIGKDPEYSWRSPSEKGTNFGGATDVYIFGGNLRNGGVVYSPYSSSDINNHNYIPQQYHIMDVYAELIEAMGYPAGAALVPYNRNTLNLFN